jgi:hypothetical protein
MPRKSGGDPNHESVAAPTPEKLGDRAIQPLE